MIIAFALLLGILINIIKSYLWYKKLGLLDCFLIIIGLILLIYIISQKINV
ncbi:Uncharacterised protein [Moraxella bovis]|uniref:Uncharacterized protein n=1 Tax=Moraxella bovis TaxID=476 RepID=A0A378PND0_MORBO|nr:Uncharacterised protein [Moraxella bovis]